MKGRRLRGLKEEGEGALSVSIVIQPLDEFRASPLPSSALPTSGPNSQWVPCRALLLRLIGKAGELWGCRLAASGDICF